jgi:hypothetical protein
MPLNIKEYCTLSKTIAVSVKIETFVYLIMSTQSHFPTLCAKEAQVYTLSAGSAVTIANITFSYTGKLFQPIEEKHWLDIYTDVTLSSGEKVGQISVEYNFTKKSEHGASVAIYFQQEDGRVHNLCDKTVRYM